ncbi:transcription elongation factor GreA [Candidatus Peregrinibacteria bacterium]|nr:transcription elongation factor GreA [Candidatus Peregrinibacteria bacterium]
MPKKTKTTKKDKKEEFLTEDGKKATLITKAGLEKLKEEFEYLKKIKRKEVAARIKEAISYGDLSENSEYEEAKNEQAFVEGRILELEEKIKNAKIISEKHSKTVQLGTKVVLKNLSKSKAEDEIYTIVGSTEADPFDGKISNESPVGNALLDKKKGDKIKVSVPAGTVEYEIKKVD